MSEDQKVIVGLGEVLWDLLPTGKQLGGAPMNFAYHASMLGNQGVVVSRIGDDELGSEIENLLLDLKLSVKGLQIDATHPTGTVDVEIDAEGQPSYDIIENVAWDHIEWTESMQQIAAQADAVIFGSLAQRSKQSRETIRTFLQATREDCLRFYDINIRQHFFSREILEDSLKLASAVKLNDIELEKVTEMLDLGAEADQTAARNLRQMFDLDLVCVTCGERGSWLLSEGDIDMHPGIPVDVADAVGAGDAFSAALCHQFLKDTDLETMNNAANTLGSWVASQNGATPPIDDSIMTMVI